MTEAGVNHVMRLFLHHVCEAGAFPAFSPREPEGWLARAEAAVDAVCEDAALDPA